MSLRLEYSQDFSAGLKRLMAEECQKALKALEDPANDTERHTGVHEARKSFKKMRAMLRMIRDEADYYKWENRFFRELGRQISEIRDATSHLEALDQLEEQYSSKLYKNTFSRLRQALEDYREKLAGIIFYDENRLEDIREKLSGKKEQIRKWPLEIKNFEQIRPSLKRVYKRGLKGLAKCHEKGRSEDFHEWRKRMKYLRYQIDVLHPTWPQTMQTLEDELHDLTDLVGFDHDLHNLNEQVKEIESAFENKEEEILFKSLLSQQREYLQKHALIKGDKFYHDSPDEFCNRLEQYWKSYQRELEEDLPKKKKLEY